MHSSLDKIRNAARVVGMTTALVGSVGLAGASASTATVTGGNSITGASSLNQNNYSLSDVFNHTRTNYATIGNSGSATVNTGSNLVSANTSVLGGGSGSGAVNVSGAFNNSVNTGAMMPASLGLGGTSVNVSGGNNTTGNSSTNQNNTTVSSVQNKTMTNVAQVGNSFSLQANTGNNATVANTTVTGGGTSGNISANFQTTNNVNGGGSTMGGTVVPTTVSANFGNGTTGFGSLNQNNLNVSSTQNESITNTANVSNAFSVNANTGGNTVSGNTTVSGTGTGGVNVNFSATNNANY